MARRFQVVLLIALALGVVGLASPALGADPASLVHLPKPSSVHTEPLHVPSKTLMGPGPSTAHPRVLQAAKLPLLGHLHGEFVKIMIEVQEQLRYAFQTTSKYVLAVSGTGHAAMEAAVANFVEPGDVVLVGVNGIWGERMADLVERYAGVVVRLEKPGGQVFHPDEVERELVANPEIGLFFLRTASPPRGPSSRSRHGRRVQEARSALLPGHGLHPGCVPFNVDKHGVDITHSGSQSVWALLRGLAPDGQLGGHGQAQAEKTKPFTYYSDLNLLGEYWGFEDNPRWYHHTGMVTNMYTLRRPQHPAGRGWVFLASLSLLPGALADTISTLPRHGEGRRRPGRGTARPQRGSGPDWRGWALSSSWRTPRTGCPR